MATQCLRNRIDGILQFMTPHWAFVNCHMVNYLTDDHWETYVPLELRREILSHDSIESCIEAVFWNMPEKSRSASNFEEFIKFRQQASEHCLHSFEDIIKTPEQFKSDILGITKAVDQQIKIKEFLTEKKRHEVEITADLVNDLIRFSPWAEKCIIVDAGDGKGYLSSRLCLEYGYKVLGIDSNTANTERAIERNQKLKKAWNGLKKRAELESKGIVPQRGINWKQERQQNSLPEETNLSNQTANYRTIHKFITSDLELDSIMQQEFSDCVPNIKPALCLTGLHTCGNLASSCLKLFHSQKSCKLICNIGCCYHLLKEQCSGQEFFGNKRILEISKECGFPLSQYMQEKKITLGRNARMLAAQSIERNMAVQELPNISLYYRALLEVLICEQHPDLKNCIQVGKIRRFKNFVDYVELCRKKNSNLNLKKQRIVDILKLEEERQSKKYLHLFYLLRMTFAPILESLILLDRLLYLREMGHKQSFLIPLFDPVVSPRHYAIVAIKTD